VRFLQSVLLVIGSTALGTTLGYFGLILVAASMQRPGQEPWQAAYGQFMAGLMCGAPLGSLAGLCLSFGWIISRDRSRVWGVFVWLGVLLGLALGPVVSHRWQVDQAAGWWGTAIVSAACGTVGGLIAAACVGSWEDRKWR
jgi:hypothetical protein